MLNSEKTAIVRRSLPKPVRSALQYLTGKVLDYGCGRGIVEEKLGHAIVTSYDPYYRPEKPQGKFDTVLCVYVLNVINEPERREVLSEVYNYIEGNGVLVVAIRLKSVVDSLAKINDWKAQEDGYLTHVGTFQKGFTEDEVITFVENEGFKFLEQTDHSTFVFRRENVR